MSDLADLAQAQNERLEAVRLQNIRWQAGCRPQDATGVCLNCGAKIAEGLRWCDADCRDDWQHRNARGSAPFAGADGNGSPYQASSAEGLPAPFPKGGGA